MSIRIFVICLVCAFFQSKAQTGTNETVVVVKPFRVQSYTNRMVLSEREPPESISGEVIFAYGKRFMLMIENGKSIVIQGYPNSEQIAVGQKLTFYAQKIGVIQGANQDGTPMTGEVRELWEWYDLALAKREADLEVRRITEIQNKQKEAVSRFERARARIAQNNALKANMVAAEKGDAYGLLRMGERYRDGDGVEKNLDKARDYFIRAERAGSITAKEALERLNQP